MVEDLNGEHWYMSYWCVLRKVHLIDDILDFLSLINIDSPALEDLYCNANIILYADLILDV